MERTEGELCTRLADGLCGNHTYCLTLLHHLSGGKVAAVALHADTMLALTGEHRTNLDALDRRILDFLCNLLSYLLTCGHNQMACGGMYDIVH